jgi:hypothetical protein
MLVNLINAGKKVYLPQVTSRVYLHKKQYSRIKSLRQFTFHTRILIPVEFLKQNRFLLEQSVILVLSYELAPLDTEEPYIKTHGILNKLTT